MPAARFGAVCGNRGGLPLPGSTLQARPCPPLWAALHKGAPYEVVKGDNASSFVLHTPFSSLSLFIEMPMPLHKPALSK